MKLFCSSISSDSITVPNNLIMWLKENIGNIEYDFDDDYPSYQNNNVESNNNYYNYQYDSTGITGANVLSEMRPLPTKPAFIMGQNVIKYCNKIF